VGGGGVRRQMLWVAPLNRTLFWVWFASWAHLTSSVSCRRAQVHWAAWCLLSLSYLLLLPSVRSTANGYTSH